MFRRSSSKFNKHCVKTPRDYKENRDYYIFSSLDEYVSAAEKALNRSADDQNVFVFYNKPDNHYVKLVPIENETIKNNSTYDCVFYTGDNEILSLFPVNEYYLNQAKNRLKQIN